MHSIEILNISTKVTIVSTHNFVGELDVGRDDDVAVVNGKPPAPDGQPADVGDLELARKCQQNVLVSHLLQ